MIESECVMGRFVIVELDGDLIRDVLKEFHKNGTIEIVKWYIAEENRTAFSDFPSAEVFITSWRRGLSYTPTLTETEERRLFAELDYILANFARDTEFYRIPYYEYKHVVHMMANYFADVMRRVRAEAILFQDLPHGPVDSVIYAAARILGIRTYALVPSEQTDFFHICTSIEDYGIFEICPRLQEKEQSVIHVEKAYQKKLAYMTEERIREDLGKSAKQKFRLFMHPRTWFAERWAMLKRHGDKYDSVADFIERRIVLGISRYFRTKEYHRAARRAEASNISWSEKYVYFPLHLQPEMTTDTLGGCYRDQLLAVEQLARILPKDWLIYVKENPKQLFWMREKYFFKRLSCLPQVRYISRSVDTYQLMKHSQFVATISGTAGWEAISGGKPAVVFGQCWYKNFPGVFSFSDELDAEAVAGYFIEHRAVEQAFSAYRGKALKGIFRSDCLRDAKDFDAGENHKNMLQAMEFLFVKLNGANS